MPPPPPRPSPPPTHTLPSPPPPKKKRGERERGNGKLLLLVGFCSFFSILKARQIANHGRCQGDSLVSAKRILRTTRKSRMSLASFKPKQALRVSNHLNQCRSGLSRISEVSFLGSLAFWRFRHRALGVFSFFLFFFFPISLDTTQ